VYFVEYSDPFNELCSTKHGFPLAERAQRLRAIFMHDYLGILMDMCSWTCTNPDHDVVRQKSVLCSYRGCNHWSCPRCSYQNTTEDGECMICGFWKPTRVGEDDIRDMRSPYMGGHVRAKLRKVSLRSFDAHA
jgi:hypothetical protein